MSKDPIIYAGFADGLEELNHAAVSSLMVKTPAGRAYKKNSGIYLDSVHTSSIDVWNDQHLLLEKKFERNFASHGGKVYMGAAGFLNLGYIAAAKPAAAILFDVNVAQTVFWKDVIQALADHADVKGFIDFLEQERIDLPSKLKKTFNRFSVETSGSLSDGFNSLETITQKTIYRRFDNGILDWLNEKSVARKADRRWIKYGYDHLHIMAKNGAIGAITLDVTDKKACQQLKSHLEKVRYRTMSVDKETPKKQGRGALVDIMYVSNIFDFLQESGCTDWSGRPLVDATPEKARKNLETFINPKGAKIIDDCPDPKNLTWPEISFPWPKNIF